MNEFQNVRLISYFFLIDWQPYYLPLILYLCIYILFFS